MLGRLTCMLAAGLGFVGGFLLATAVAQDGSHNPRGLLGPFLPPPRRQAPRAAKRPSGRRSAATDGQHPSRKPAKGKSKSSRRKKNP